MKGLIFHCTHRVDKKQTNRYSDHVHYYLGEVTAASPNDHFSRLRYLYLHFSNIGVVIYTDSTHLVYDICSVCRSVIDALICL